MTRRRIPCALISISGLVDDRYQAQGASCLEGKPGAKPAFSDSEVITLMARMDGIPSPDETQFIALIRSHDGALFPRLLPQRRFNRRARDVRLRVDMFRRSLLDWLGVPR